MLFRYLFHPDYMLGSVKERAFLEKDFHHQQGGQKQLFCTQSHFFRSPSSKAQSEA